MFHKTLPNKLLPHGDGILEISDEYGNIITAPYHLVNGKKLRIDIVWHK